MPRSITVAVLVACVLVTGASADSLWLRAEESGTARSIFADDRAASVGDIVYVLITETTTATSAATTEMNRDSSSSGLAGGLLSFLPFFSWDNQEDYESGGTTVRQGALTGRMTARLVEEVAPGVYRIEGTREVSVNEENQRMILTGLVRVSDITSANTIRSDQVADAAISYSGIGPIAKKNKPGLLTRLVNFLF
jgi:flagellar L-ring protein precursor FlgH